MFSIYFNSTQPLVGVGGRYIGIGTRLMNYQGPFNGNPGNDDKSLGFSDDGKYYYNGSVQVSGLPTWTSEDIIDIAISASDTSKIWLRVNNGYWNGNVVNNPETGVGGLGISGITSYYPAVCPGIYGNMTILNSGYQTPNNFIRLGTNVNSSVGFNRTSGFTDGSFITLAEYVSRKYSTPQTFATATDASTWLTNNGFWNSYSSVTPTPTATLGITPTPSVTPTLTPTPSTSPVPVTGYGYNLVVLPYNPPTSGNTIFPTFATPGLNSGTTNPNTFGVNGIYWNIIDNSSVDRTSYYSGMTGVSVTAYFTQNSNTVIYSGSPTAFIYDIAAGGGFNYNPGNVPNQLVLIQSASTNFVTGQTVYISYVVN
jgi:hypothetical protein